MNVRICGHRGVAAHAPENTLAGITLARELGLKHVEVDLRLTRDGKVVVHHDAELGRTVRGHGKIRDLDLLFLQELDAGSWFATEYSQQRIPTLDDLLEAGGNKLFWNLELKVDEGADTEVGERLISEVVHTLAARGVSRRAILTSFDHDLIRRAMGFAEVPGCGFIWGKRGRISITREDAVTVYSVRHKLITADLVTRIHDSGREVHAWTVNRGRDLERMVALGVDVVISDDPGRMLDLIGRGSPRP